MIELDRVENQYGEQDVELWADNEYLHVIVHEDWANESHGSGWYVRDESGELGVYPSLGDAFDYLRTSQVWGEVTLAPARRLIADMTYEDETDAGRYLLEYLATYGAVGIDPQALAKLAFARLEEE
jgi:hypothetical protein